VTCPFCRCEIRSTEQIVVEPFSKTPPVKVASAPPEKVSSVDEDDSGNFEVWIVHLIIPRSLGWLTTIKGKLSLKIVI